MKKIAACTMLLLAIGFTSMAQCNKKMKWKALKTEFVRSSGEVDSKDEAVTVTTGQDSISVVAENGEEAMMGKITDYVCNWNDKNSGKINFKSEVTDKQGTIRHATVTIESKDGKVTILLEATEEDTKIRLPVDAYEEVK